MLDRVRRGLRISSLIVVFAGFLGLVTVPGYPVALIALPLVLLPFVPLGERLDEQSANYRTITNFIARAYFFIAIPLSVVTLDLLDAVLALVIFIQSYTLVHRKYERNYYHIFLMAFFMLLAACVQQPEPEVALSLLLFLVSVSAALIFLRLEVEAREAGDAASPDIVGLRAAEATVADLRSTGADWGFATAVTLVALCAFALSAVFFMFTPRIEAGLLGRVDTPIMETGIPSSVDLSSGGLLTENTAPVMRVVFPELPNGTFPGEQYWRVTTLPFYESAQWRKRGLKSDYEPDVPDLFPQQMMFARRSPDAVERSPQPDTPRVLQEVYIDDVPDEGLPVLDFVQRVELIGRGKNMGIGWDGDRDFTVNFAAPSARRINYRAYSEVTQPSPDALRSDPCDYAEMQDNRDYDLLTYHDLLPETQVLVREVVAGQTNVYDQAVAIDRYLSGPGFAYTLDTPALPAQHAIDAFLSEVRVGHCEIFASAMALMLRSLGVPARVVMGYRGGEWNPSDNSYTVRQSMAHLWVEVLFPQHGWVRFDPSPQSDDAPPGTFEQVGLTIGGMVLRAKMLWYRDVIGFTQAPGLGEVRAAAAGILPGFWWTEPRGHAAAEPLAERVRALGFIIAGASAVLILLLLRRRRTQRVDFRPTEDQARAIRLFRRYTYELERLGLATGGRAAEEIIAAAEAREDIDHVTVREAMLAYSAARFGERPLPPAEFNALLRRCKRLQQDLRVGLVQARGRG